MSRRDRLLVAGALLLGLFFIAQNAWQMDWALERFNAYYRPLDLAGAPPVAQGRVPKLFWDDDSYMHLALLREMHESGALRQPHWTHVDNAPDGRVVYWSSLYLSWVRAIAWVRAWVTGTDFLASLEPAAALANPLLHALLLAAFAAILSRRVGGGPAALMVLALATAPRLLAVDLKPFNVDHQGLHFAAFLGALLALVIGGCGHVTGGDASRLRARNAFLLSGALAGMGAWVGVVRQDAAWIVAAPGIIAAILARYSADGRETGSGGAGGHYEPDLWRAWGAAAAMVSLCGYLFEYFPDHLDRSRLEVNGPLQSLAFFCAGQLLCVVARVRHEPGFKVDRGVAARLLAAVAGLCALPVCVLLAPAGWVALRDPGFHQVLMPVGEMVSPFNRYGARALLVLANELGLLMIVLPLASLPLLWMRSLAPEVRAAILLTAPATLLFSVLFVFHQPTWGYFLCAASLAHLLAVLLAVRSLALGGAHRTAVWAACSMTLLGQLLFNMNGVVDESRAIRLGKLNPPDLVEAARFREIAYNLSLLDPDRPPVFISPPALGAKLAYFGRGSAIGTQYENLPGIGATLDFFSDTGDLHVARELARARKVNYLVIVPGRLLVQTSVRLPPVRTPGVEGLTLGERLSLPEPVVPDWMEPIPWPDLFPGARSSLRIYRVSP